MSKIMKQKQNLELTDAEKIDFLAKFNYYQMYLKYENYICNGGVKKALSIITTVLNLGLGALCLAFLNPVTALMAIAFFTAWGSTLFAINAVPARNINSKILKCSNGKINLQKYTELESSGEVDKWKEQFKDELLKYDYSKFETSISEYTPNRNRTENEAHQTIDCPQQQTAHQTKQTDGNER